MPKCLECGAVSHHPQFCGSAHKSAYHNRRARRGALLYDAMVLSRQHPKATTDREWPERIEALFAEWQREDAEAGRTRSTMTMGEINYKLPHVRVLGSYDEPSGGG